MSRIHGEAGVGEIRRPWKAVVQVSGDSLGMAIVLAETDGLGNPSYGLVDFAGFAGYSALRFAPPTHRRAFFFA